MRTIITILTASLLMFSCKETHKPEEAIKAMKSDNEVNKDITLTKTKPTIGTIHETENLKLFGDTTIEKTKISHALIKFEPYIGFNDFKVSKIDNKKYVDIDLRSNKAARSYRTRLTKGYESDTANFAGHYTFIYFGCGSPCQGSFIIDRTTGKIYNSPSASLGYDYRVNSKMLIVNPPDSNGFYQNYFTINQ